MRVDRDGNSIAGRRYRFYKLLEPNPWGKVVYGYVGWDRLTPGTYGGGQGFVFRPRALDDIAKADRFVLTFTPMEGMPGLKRCEQLVKTTFDKMLKEVG